VFSSSFTIRPTAPELNRHYFFQRLRKTSRPFPARFRDAAHPLECLPSVVAHSLDPHASARNTGKVLAHLHSAFRTLAEAIVFGAAYLSIQNHNHSGENAAPLIGTHSQ